MTMTRAIRARRLRAGSMHLRARAILTLFAPRRRRQRKVIFHDRVSGNVCNAKIIIARKPRRGSRPARVIFSRQFPRRDVRGNLALTESRIVFHVTRITSDAPPPSPVRPKIARNFAKMTIGLLTTSDPECIFFLNIRETECVRAFFGLRVHGKSSEFPD